MAKRKTKKPAGNEGAKNSLPCVVNVGPIPEWSHIGMATLVPGTRQMLVPSQDTDCVSLIDLESLTVLGTAQLDEGAAPWHALATPDKRHAYVTNARFRGHIDNQPLEDSVVSVVDMKTMKEVAQVPVGAQPAMIEMDAERDVAYVTNQSSASVSVISLKTRKNLATIEVGKAPFWTRLTPKGDMLVVGNFEDATLSLIDPDSRRVVNTVPVGVARMAAPYPEYGAGDTVGFSISSDGIAYVANWRSGTIAAVKLYDTLNFGRRAIVYTEKAIELPFHVELDENLGLMVVGSYDAGKSRIAVFDFDERVRKGNQLGRAISNFPTDGTVIPQGQAAATNYWISQPFENRIIGFLPQGTGVRNPIDMMAIVI